MTEKKNCSLAFKKCNFFINFINFNCPKKKKKKKETQKSDCQSSARMIFGLLNKPLRKILKVPVVHFVYNIIPLFNL